MNEYDEGDLIVCTGTFIDPDNLDPSGNPSPIDPTTVEFRYSVRRAQGSPPGPVMTLTYTDGTEPAPGQLVRIGEGVYEAQVDSTGLPGYWTARYVSTGLGQASQPWRLFVRAAPI